MTRFRALLKLTCMSRQEASEYLGVSDGCIANWLIGRRTCPDSVYDKLTDYIIENNASSTTDVHKVLKEAKQF